MSKQDKALLGKFKDEYLKILDETNVLSGTLERKKNIIADLESRIAKDDGYVRVVCPRCKGLGVVSYGGADAVSDPLIVDQCPQCHTKGWVLGEIFFETAEYDQTYNEIPWGIS